MNDLLAQLPLLLSWQEGTDVVRAACELHVLCSYKRLHDWSEHTASGLYTEVARLPKQNQKRLLLAPRVVHLFYNDQPGDHEIAMMREFIEMEKAVSKSAEVCSQGGWTALGDCYLPSDGQRPSTSAFDGWKSDQRYDAPKAAHIVLDAYSPTWDSRAPQSWGKLTRHDITDLPLIQERIISAVRLIKSVNEITALTVGACIRSIALMKTPDRPERATSASARPLIGILMLSNAHSECWTEANFVDSIVHEAIHSLIYKIQLTSPLYEDDDAAEVIAARSPWSGRILPLHSFVHACFVWYGLWNFWSLATEHLPSGHGHLVRAQKGFSNGCPLSDISREAYDCIRPDVRRVISDLSQRVA
jgi:hypothetical protein